VPIRVIVRAATAQAATLREANRVESTVCDSQARLHHHLGIVRTTITGTEHSSVAGRNLRPSAATRNIALRFLTVSVEDKDLRTRRRSPRSRLFGGTIPWARWANSYCYNTV